MIQFMDDHELLREYVRDRSQDAFRELVDRHLAMVYGSARRMVRDSHLAEDVVQGVFRTLAEKAGTLRRQQVIAGWLYQTTRHLAMHAVRTEQRRREREQVAVAMQALEGEAETNRILDELEPALDQLDAGDRDLLVLRYFEDRSLRDVGREVGISEDAARMRVNRALERLRAVFEKQGVTTSSGLLTTVLLSTAATTVPAGLAATITTTALTGLSAGIGAGMGTAATAASWWTAKTIAAVAGAAAITGAGLLLYVQRTEPLPPPSAQAPASAPQTTEQVVVGESVPDSQSAGDAVTAMPSAEEAGRRADVEGPREEPPTAEAQRLVEEAYALREQQRYEDAERLVNEALRLSPSFPDAHLVLGLVHEGLGRLEEAVSAHTRAVELRPGYVQAWYERSRIMLAMKRHEEAIADCTRAIQIDPSFWQAWLGRGRARYEQGRYEEAMRDLDRSLELNPRFVEAYDYRAIIHMRHGEPDLALTNRRLAVEQEPDIALLHLRYGSTLWLLERFEEALESLSRAIELDPNHPGAWRERGVVHARLRRWNEAIEDYTETLRLQPQNHHIYSNRGMTWFELDEPDKALADLDRAVRMDPDRALYYLNRGRILLRLNRPREALADLSRSIELQPQRNAEAWYQRGRAYRDLGELDMALEDLLKVVAWEPGWMYAWNDLGYVRFQRREYAQAIHDLERALELKPDLEYAAYMAGRTALALHQPDRAIEFLTHALTIRPDEPWTLFYRAQAKARSGHLPDAIADLNEVVRLRPDSGRFRFERAWFHVRAQNLDAAVADAIAGLTDERLHEIDRRYLGILAALGQRSDVPAKPVQAALDELTMPADATWPAPVIRFLKGDLPFDQMNAAARNATEQAQARAFAGWFDLVEGRHNEAREHLQWVVQHAEERGFGHGLAAALLDRLANASGANTEKQP
jgi:RNA polymerase sigma factor (sigma-70 family)